MAELCKIMNKISKDLCHYHNSSVIDAKIFCDVKNDYFSKKK